MLDSNIKTQLKAYMEKLVSPIELVATLDDSNKARELRALLEDIASVSDKITLLENGHDARCPSFYIRKRGDTARIRFAGLPMGHEFTSLVLALLQASGYPPKIDADVIEQIKNLPGEYRFETYISMSCHNCPEVVQSLNTLAALNPNIQHVMIDGALYQNEINDRQIMAVPSVFMNGEAFSQGRLGIAEILAKLDTGAEEREAVKLARKEPFDVLIVGGGPAGSAAAVYAARKGIRTGLVAERFGGQVMDTLAIENLISVPHTEGPQLVRALEQHVKEYDVDIMNLQRAAALIPAENGGLHEIRLANGAVLKAKTLILATGARWREMNVPGEQEYRGRGVAYCPHCDGPLFKGKRVAVIGGGNSGVEAAIDLAGIVAQVTLLEFADTLRADAVLQKKLFRLPNVTVIQTAQTSEVIGNGEKVNALLYTDRKSGMSHRIELEGIFVQIGLLPNTDWMKGTVELSRYGEIQVDARGQTNVPGIFAAGDATTVPFKQIIIAMGEGAKASLAAFDHLIRSATPA
ncbi:MAG: alkyl hydroperoxide reductase subunit F [Gammaproteobacteria bacterium]|nr:alkyl hydroperoxide reductase subunit F [Gammaproteobacteria bacterium]